MPTTVVLDLSQFAAYLQRVGKDRLSLEKPFRQIALLLASATRQNFDRAASPDGTPWAPFKRTPSAKRGGPAAKLLRDTGLLMSSYGAGAGHVERVSGVALEWGSNVDRAAWHQFGTRAIPARPHVGVTPELLQKVDFVITQFLGNSLLPGGGNG